MDLALHLLILALHKIVEDMHETDLVSLLLQALSLEYRVKSSIYVSPDLEVLMFHHIIKNLNDTDLRSKLLTLIFSFATE